MRNEQEEIVDVYGGMRRQHVISIDFTFTPYRTLFDPDIYLSVLEHTWPIMEVDVQIISYMYRELSLIVEYKGHKETRDIERKRRYWKR